MLYFKLALNFFQIWGLYCSFWNLSLASVVFLEILLLIYRLLLRVTHRQLIWLISAFNWRNLFIILSNLIFIIYIWFQSSSSILITNLRMTVLSIKLTSILWHKSNFISFGTRVLLTKQSNILYHMHIWHLVTSFWIWLKIIWINKFIWK